LSKAGRISIRPFLFLPDLHARIPRKSCAALVEEDELLMLNAELMSRLILVYVGIGIADEENIIPLHVPEEMLAFIAAPVLIGYYVENKIH
jgi:hypothetical protein